MNLFTRGLKTLRKNLNEREFSIPSNKILNDENLFKCFDKISNNYIYDNVNLEGRMGGNSRSILDDAISETEVEIAIKNSKNKSAPGRDLISFLILKSLPIESHKWIASLFNVVFNIGGFPESWKECNICFIPNGNDKGYRPIALSNTILKII